MKAVLKLVTSWMSGTPLTRGLTVCGLALVLLSLVSQRVFPFWTLGSGYYHGLSLALQALISLLSWLGMMALFAGTATMPASLLQLAGSRQLQILPHGRIKVLVSALLLISGLSLLSATLAYLAFVDFPAELPPIFLNTLKGSLFAYTLCYLIIGLIGIHRTPLTLLAGVLLVIVCLFVPLRLILGHPVLHEWLNLGTLLLWIVVALLIFTAHRLLELWRGRSLSALLPARPGSGQGFSMDNPAVDYLLANNQPWLPAVAAVVQVVVASLLIRMIEVWLFFLVLMGAIAGACTCLAAGRSRRLWLRADHARAELFRLVEASYWRHNCYPLGVLILLLVTIGTYLDLRLPLLAAGVPLLVLAVFAGTNLGLLMTRGLGGFESACTVLTMLLLMGAAYASAELPPRYPLLLGLDLVLLVAACGFRALAAKRWTQLDWRLC